MPSPLGQPSDIRENPTATRSAGLYFILINGVGLALVASGWNERGPSEQARAVGVVITVTAILFGVSCHRWPWRLPLVVWNVLPALAVGEIWVLTLIGDNPTGSSLALLLPPYYCAQFLSLPRTAVTLVLGFLAEAALAMRFQLAADAVTETGIYATVAALIVLATVNLRRQRDRMVARLEAESVTDPLTGLLNRRGFDRFLDMEIARAHRSGEELTVITFDVDHFKAVNDTHGHAAGDAVLEAVATSLRRVCRVTDGLARLGGDEFAVLLPGTDVTGGTGVAERLRRALADQAAAVTPAPTLSIGVAALSGCVQSAAELIEAADHALYAAKRAGRDRVAISVPEERFG